MKGAEEKEIYVQAKSLKLRILVKYTISKYLCLILCA